MRKIHKNVPVLFKPYKWKVVEEKADESTNKSNETIFAIGNGYLGVRGFFEEGFYGESHNTETTTMINGIYEYFDYNHIWRRPGFPARFHAITNQANPFEVNIEIDNEKLDLKGDIKNYSRTLYLETGEVVREFIFNTKSGKKVKLEFRRFASQTDIHSLLNKINITVDKEAEVIIKTQLNSALKSGTPKEEMSKANDEVFEFLKSERRDEQKYIEYKIRKSGFICGCAVKEIINCGYEKCENKTLSGLTDIYKIQAKSNKQISIERFITYSTSRESENILDFCLSENKTLSKKGYDFSLLKNTEVWLNFWNTVGIEIDSDELIEQGIRFSMFHIFQSTGKDGITNISANGLTGTGYSGHTFWDTEIFMMPMYIYTNPEIAKQLLMYRYNILDKARERAAEMDDKGALFSWNSINGEECGHVFEAATAQYHINNDIFYAIYRYFEATNDKDFLFDFGLEILLEISKCLAHRGNFIEHKDGKFCINVICGPDEYNPVVDNNLYTNLLTKKQLEFTLKAAELLKNADTQKYDRLINKCKIDEKELNLFKKAADKMNLPYDEKLQIYKQDDNFLDKDPIDIENIPLNKLPLLTNMHPLNLWRYQVIKQADIVLLTFLCSDFFDKKMRKKIFDFYEPKTIHDSSLSAGIHSIVACDIGYESEAYQYLKQSARMDLDNVNKNTAYGIHAACMGSSWMMLVNGYGGLRIYDDKMHFKPYCDERWNNYSFKVKYNNNIIKVNVSKKETVYSLIKGTKTELYHKDKLIVLDCKNSTVKTEI